MSLNSVMLSSVNILLGKYTGQDDIVIGGVIANRHHQQTVGNIGFFVNTQANRTILSNSQNFEELIQQVHQDQIEAQLHQDLPFEKLVNELAVERDVSKHPIFQLLFELQSNDLENEKSEKQHEYFKPFLIDESDEAAKFDLSFYIIEAENELVGQINYA
ncbi:condensation domain-containing protein, partial [Dolichospermum sp. ST_sed2]|nr:condensation domain-containing protein [Dolichospermum sp. ST_sed2]